MLRFVLVLGLAILFSSCVQFPGSNNTIPEEAENAAQKILKEILDKNIDGVKGLSAAAMLEIEDIDESLKKVLSYIPDDKVKNVEPIYVEIRKNEDPDNPFPIYRSLFEAEYDEGFVTLDMYIHDQSKCCLLRHITINKHDERPSTRNNLTFGDKKPRHYIFFALLFLMPAFIIFTLVKCYRNKLMAKKKRWMFFIAFGLWGLSLNWTTGAIGQEFFEISRTSAGSANFTFNFLSFNLLGAGILKDQMFGPWILTIGFPVGAVLYWILHGRGQAVKKTFD